MTKAERLEALKQEVSKLSRDLAVEADFIERALDENADSAVEGEFLFARDFDDGPKLLRMRLNEAWWKMHVEAESLEEVARRCEKELAGAIERLPEPSEESWEPYHAEYLRKMDAYNEAADKAHQLFTEWRAYYAKYIKPFRERELAEDSSS